eukprot:jgi/Tetstr1/422452/TSEL_013290.t1
MEAGTRAGAGADVAAWCVVSHGSGLGESEGWRSSCTTARVAAVAASCAMVRISATIWDICSAEAACWICTARCADAELTCPQEAGDRRARRDETEHTAGSDARHPTTRQIHAARVWIPAPGIWRRSKKQCPGDR